jgi:hypothetical protein
VESVLRDSGEFGFAGVQLRLLYRRRFGGSLMDDLRSCGMADLHSFMDSLAFTRKETDEGDHVYHYLRPVPSTRIGVFVRVAV